VEGRAAGEIDELVEGVRHRWGGVALPTDIALREELELAGGEDGTGNLAVLDVKGERRLAARAREERVAGVDVALGLQERGEDALQVGGAAAKFDDDERDLGEGEAVLGKKRARLVGIVANEAHDGGVGRVEDAERDDMDVRLREDLHDVEQPADLVFHEDGKLLHLFLERALGGLQFVWRGFHDAGAELAKRPGDCHERNAG
jgi:hypothetical protein